MNSIEKLSLIVTIVGARNIPMRYAGHDNSLLNAKGAARPGNNISLRNVMETVENDDFMQQEFLEEGEHSIVSLYIQIQFQNTTVKSRKVLGCSPQ